MYWYVYGSYVYIDTYIYIYVFWCIKQISYIYIYIVYICVYEMKDDESIWNLGRQCSSRLQYFHSTRSTPRDLRCWQSVEARWWHVGQWCLPQVSASAVLLECCPRPGTESSGSDTLTSMPKRRADRAESHTWIQLHCLVPCLRQSIRADLWLAMNILAHSIPFLLSWILTCLLAARQPGTTFKAQRRWILRAKSMLGESWKKAEYIEESDSFSILAKNGNCDDGNCEDAICEEGNCDDGNCDDGWVAVGLPRQL